MAHAELVNALRMAAAELNSHDATPFLDGPYADSRELGAFLAVAAARIEQGDMDTLPELRRIFAPRSDWDHAGGPHALADRIEPMLRTPLTGTHVASQGVAGQPAPKPRWSVDRGRLKLAVEGDQDGLRVPLPFHDRAQFGRFVGDLERTLLSQGITDATVVLIGPGATGWSGNAKRYLDYIEHGGTKEGWFDYGAWKPGSDTDFVIFSDQALVQAKDVMEHNPQIDVEYRLFKNGEAPTEVNKSGRPGFANAPLGAQLLALSLWWNRELYGTSNPQVGGLDFKLNLDINLARLSKPLTVYRGPEAAAREQRRSAAPR